MLVIRPAVKVDVESPPMLMLGLGIGVAGGSGCAGRGLEGVCGIFGGTGFW
jgi:hypothetical protein